MLFEWLCRRRGGGPSHAEHKVRAEPAAGVLAGGDKVAIILWGRSLRFFATKYGVNLRSLRLLDGAPPHPTDWRRGR